MVEEKKWWVGELFDWNEVVVVKGFSILMILLTMEGSWLILIFQRNI